jgi:hypothetical protein
MSCILNLNWNVLQASVNVVTVARPSPYEPSPYDVIVLHLELQKLLADC